LTQPSTIAIDGPAASGKSTIGELLARRLGYVYFDTGVMYRAVTWVALRDGVSIEDEAEVTALAERVNIDIVRPSVDDGRQYTVLADGQDITWQIRYPEVNRAVSPVSAYRGVRAAMSAQQRRIAGQGRIVMVGRDIGTVVLPDAELKIYLDGTLDVRAWRRYREIIARGEPAEYDQVRRSVQQRDEIDSSRAFAPLRAAPDAVVIDTTLLSVDQVMDQVQALVDCWLTQIP
jgi:cytidylate kinase